MNKQLISIILPCYNEKDNVILLIKKIKEILIDYIYEIIIIDDNSPDKTYETVNRLNFSHVRPILRVKDKGLANSIRCGLEESNGDVLVVMDSDFNHRPEYLPFMIDNIKYYDCISASRFVYGGKMDSKIRYTLSWIFNIFARIVTKGMVTDCLYGYFAIKRHTLSRINFNDIFWGYGDYYIRLIYYLQKINTKILQFPAVNGKRVSGKGNSRFLRTFWQYFKEIFKLAFKKRY